MNVTSSSTNATSVSLSWQPLDPLKFGGSVSHYRVEIVDLLRGERFNYTINSSTNAELDFLKPFTPYEFKVFGSTGSWEGNITDIISLKTQEDGRLALNKVGLNVWSLQDNVKMICKTCHVDCKISSNSALAEKGDILFDYFQTCLQMHSKRLLLITHDNFQTWPCCTRYSSRIRQISCYKSNSVCRGEK